MQRSEFSKRLIYNFNVTAGVGGDLASNFLRHLSKREFSFQSWRGSFRIESSQVGYKTTLNLSHLSVFNPGGTGCLSLALRSKSSF